VTSNIDDDKAQAVARAATLIDARLENGESAARHGRPQRDVAGGQVEVEQIGTHVLSGSAIAALRAFA